MNPFEELIAESIGNFCQNLRLLSVIYVNEIDQQLSHIFSSFNDLKIVRFSATYLDTHIIDGDRILTLINQSLPKKLIDDPSINE